MQRIQFMLDSNLLRATDRAARRAKLKRSALIRAALREYLKKIGIQELEDRDRKGYERVPDTGGEAALWEPEAVWPSSDVSGALGYHARRTG